MNNLIFDGFVILSYFLGIATAIHALFKKENPRSALIWVCLCLFVPFFGAAAYIIFGVNRVKLVSHEWHSYGLYGTQINRNQNNLDLFNPENLTPTLQDLTHVGNTLFKNKILPHCQVTPYFDGTEAYPAMLEAINFAKERIYLSTYIFGAHGIGKMFIEALGDAAKRGVEVKILIDGIGSLYTFPSTKRKLKKLGVDAKLFLAFGLSLNSLRYLNLRNHAKILVVDGSIGFTGGMNIHEHNRALPDEAPKIHDLHFKIEGPVVGDLQDAFLRNWYFISKKKPEQQVYFDDRPKGEMATRAVASGPYQDMPLSQLLLIAAINAAKKHIRIMTPYFIIGSSLSTALIEAALRGVTVELILPESNNLSFVKGATESMLPPLLQVGVKVFYRQGHFAHSKIFLVDDQYIYLGSANMDTRSFYLNFEFNLEVFSPSCTQILIDHFENIKTLHSREITINWLQKQNFIIKFRNSICKLFSPYL